MNLEIKYYIFKEVILISFCKMSIGLYFPTVFTIILKNLFSWKKSKSQEKKRAWPHLCKVQIQLPMLSGIHSRSKTIFKKRERENQENCATEVKAMSTLGQRWMDLDMSFGVCNQEGTHGELSREVEMFYFPISW